MSDVEILLEETDFTTLKIRDREFKIGRISLLKKLKILQYLGNSVVKKMREFREGSSNLDDIMNLLSIVDEDSFGKAMSIILQTDDIEFCKELDDEVFDIFLAFLKHNNIGKYWGKAQRVFEMGKSQIEKYQKKPPTASS